MNTKMLAALALALVALTGLIQSGETIQQSNSPDAQPATTPTTEQFTVIGYLEKRDKIIVIKSSAKGRVYSVTTKAGKVLIENVSIELLKVQAPELHDYIKTSMAADASVRTIRVR